MEDGRGEKGDRHACASHSPLPRPVESVKFSANKKTSGDRREGELWERQRGTTSTTAAGRSLQQILSCISYGIPCNVFRFTIICLCQTFHWNFLLKKKSWWKLLTVTSVNFSHCELSFGCVSSTNKILFATTVLEWKQKSKTHMYRKMAYVLLFMTVKYHHIAVAWMYTKVDNMSG